MNILQGLQCMQDGNPINFPFFFLFPWMMQLIVFHVLIPLQKPPLFGERKGSYRIECMAVHYYYYYNSSPPILI